MFTYKIKEDGRCFIYKNDKLDYSFTLDKDSEQSFEEQAERRVAKRQGVAYKEDRDKRIYEASMVRGEVSIDDAQDLITQ